MQTHRPSRSSSSRTSKTISPQRPTSPRMHSKRPSLSGPMTWLSRSSSSSSVHHPYTPSKPIRISEPQMTSAFDSVGKRSGPLGAGATVVRTPQEALAGPRHATPTSDLERETEHEIVEEEEEEQEEEEAQDDSFEERPSSRELPPIPDKDEADSPRTVGSRSTTPSRPTRPPPPAPEQYEVPSPATSSPSTPSPRRPSLKVLDSFPPVPALPANLLPSPPQPEFEAILLSTPPPNGTDPNKIIVTVETSTQMFKTTLKTLTSRPSYLSTYLQDLLSAEHDEYRDDRRDSRVSEADSSFHHMFRQHLTSSGLLQTSSNIHIFLDRPSAPYAHILSYLRLPPSSPEHPACLPRAAQLLSSSSSRLEALLELRDEARYLDLEELYRLCTEELRSRQNASIGRASMHLRAISNTSVSTSSVRSLGMNAFREVDDVREVEETQEQRRLSGDSGIGSANSHSGRSPRASLTAEVGWHSTVPSLAQRGRTPSKSVTMRGKPTGEWI